MFRSALNLEYTLPRNSASALLVNSQAKLTPEKMASSLILISREKSQLPLRHCLLTFDDGPAGIVTNELLLVLREFGVKACFCVVGSEVVARPEQARSIANDGHLLVNHTFHHRFGDLWHSDRLQSDLALCDEAVAYATGSAVLPLSWFRPPFGLLTHAVREIAARRRILPITHFAFDTWFNSAQTTRPADWIIKDANLRGGGIYILHDGLVSHPVSDLLRSTPYRGWVPGAVRQILVNLSSSGFHFPEPSQALAKLTISGCGLRIAD
jgi:peptidoglycan-N-acetylglucosamine deacetylase